MPDPWATLSIIAKWLLYLSTLWLIGTILVRLWAGAALDPVDRSLRGIAAYLALAFLLAAGAEFGLTAARLTGSWAGMTDPVILALLWNSPAGLALALRLVGGTLALGGVIIGGRALWIACAGGVLVLWSFAELGHVKGVGAVWAQVTLALHLAGLAFWIGILWPLWRLCQCPETSHIAADLGARFGRVAAGVVPMVLVAGLGLAWALLGSLEALWTTPYGRAFVAKITIVGLVLVVALFNKIRFVPALVQNIPGAAPNLARSLALEAMVFLGVISLTAGLTSLYAAPG